jgi:hypothetical protein
MYIHMYMYIYKYVFIDIEEVNIQSILYEVCQYHR